MKCFRVSWRRNKRAKKVEAPLTERYNELLIFSVKFYCDGFKRCPIFAGENEIVLTFVLFIRWARFMFIVCKKY